MKHKYPFADRLRYLFDQSIASGTGNLLVLLAAFSILVVSIAALLLSLGMVPEGEVPSHFGDSFWRALDLVIQPTAVEEPGWPYRFVTLAVAILGLLIVSVLIGILTSGIEGKLGELRRGRSLVLESGHTLILGWSPKIIPVLRELLVANENQSRAVIVILANRDKVEMEEQIAAEVGNQRRTRMIFRSGNPREPHDLEIVNPAAAKSIIVLRGENENAGAANVKTILALRKVAGTPLPCPVAVEMREEPNIDAIQRLDSNVQVVRSDELITRIVVQSARQQGMSRVYDELLSFDGNEIYLRNEPTVEGRTFREASRQYESAVLIGLWDGVGPVLLNPPAERVIASGDSIVAIAEDDDRVVVSAETPPESAIEFEDSCPDRSLAPEHVAVLGWNSCGTILLAEFDSLLSPGSTVTVIYEPELVISSPETQTSELSLPVEFRHGNVTNRSFLDSVSFESYDHIVLLSYRDVVPVEEADDRSLLTLIHLRDLLKVKNLDRNISSEIIDVRNRDLVRLPNEPNDFIASEELVSRLLVQVSEDSKIKGIFDQLLTAEGPEFHLRASSEYVNPGEEVSFSEISDLVMNRGEIAVGYRRNGEIILAPLKAHRFRLDGDDAVVVLAES